MVITNSDMRLMLEHVGPKLALVSVAGFSAAL